MHLSLRPRATLFLRVDIRRVTHPTEQHYHNAQFYNKVTFIPFFRGTYSYTIYDNERDPWWRVDLMFTYHITRVIIEGKSFLLQNDGIKSHVMIHLSSPVHIDLILIVGR